MADVNIDGARNIARAAKEYGMEKFIHVSALGADVDSPSEYGDYHIIFGSFLTISHEFLGSMPHAVHCA